MLILDTRLGPQRLGIFGSLHVFSTSRGFGFLVLMHFFSLLCCSFGTFGGVSRPCFNHVTVLLKVGVSCIYFVAIVAFVALFFLLSPLHSWRGVSLVAFRFVLSIGFFLCMVF